MRGGEAIRGVGRRGCCAGPAGPTQVPRGPRGLAGPFHQLARVHAGPRRSEREGLEPIESRKKSSVGRAC